MDLNRAYLEFEKRIVAIELWQKAVKIVVPALKKGEQFHRREFVKGLKKLIGIDVAKLLNDERRTKREILNSIDDNVKLIK